MPGGTYIDYGPWEKVIIIFPRKIEGKWHFLKYAYRKNVYKASMWGESTERLFKSEKKYLIDELRNKND